jgi:hypothetical protein
MELRSDMQKIQEKEKTIYFLINFGVKKFPVETPKHSHIQKHRTKDGENWSLPSFARPAMPRMWPTWMWNKIASRVEPLWWASNSNFCLSLAVTLITFVLVGLVTYPINILLIFPKADDHKHMTEISPTNSSHKQKFQGVD